MVAGGGSTKAEGCQLDGLANAQRLPYLDSPIPVRLSIVARGLAGVGVKGDTGGRSARERSECERVRMSGAAFTLDADGGQTALRQGGGQGHRPQHLAPQTVGQEPTQGATRSGLPSEAQRVSGWLFVFCGRLDLLWLSALVATPKKDGNAQCSACCRRTPRGPLWLAGAYHAVRPA